MGWIQQANRLLAQASNPVFFLICRRAWTATR
jgi:hypothetical protein